MQRLAQVGAGGLRIEVGPQDAHDLLAVQPVRRRQGEQLDQRGRLAPVPRRVGDGATVHNHAKRPEQLDAKLRQGDLLRHLLRPYA